MGTMRIDENELSDFLIAGGLMTRGQLSQLREEAGETPLYDLLARKNVIAEDELCRAAAHASGTKFVILSRDDIDPVALVLIPEPLARSQGIIAYRLERNVLEVALLDLDALSHLESLRMPYKVVARLTSRGSIKEGLIYYQKILKEKFGALLSQGAHVVDSLIQHALLSKAHGVHIDFSTTATLVRYRIGTVLHDAMQLPVHVGETLAGRLKSLAKLLPVSTTLQEGRFKFEHTYSSGENESHLVHVAALPTAQGERIVLRLTPEKAGHTTFALTSLGLHGDALEDVHTLLNFRSGMILVSGERRSGKTTTLYTLLTQLSHENLSIATIEEDIEHHFSHIAQTNTRPELGLDTRAGLRAILRQDPDVVMVGEIKDSETALLAATAAAKGVLVFAGVEAEDVGEAIEKMKHWGVDPLMLCATLRGVIGTQIVKRLCANDKESYRLARAEGEPLEGRVNFAKVLARLKEEGVVGEETQWKELLFSHPVSCSQCEDGYQGITGLFEVLPATLSIKEVIMQGASSETIEYQARNEGMHTVLEDGMFKAVAGITSIDEVFRLAAGGTGQISAK
ncbi:MAG TPA: ATPase, T2SS/T4P/T4SS family [Candidatus Paceibacterota bacterium]|nr:ATPase, T2SS/T4P/T4SS family [Candidatus Paceibacterota bacterium]